MSKERKLTDTDDFVQGPESDIKDNNLDPDWVAETVPGHGQGGEGSQPLGSENKDKSGRPGSYGGYED